MDRVDGATILDHKRSDYHIIFVLLKKQIFQDTIEFGRRLFESSSTQTKSISYNCKLDNPIILITTFSCLISTDNGHYNFISRCHSSRCLSWNAWLSGRQLLLHTKALNCHRGNHIHCGIFRLLWRNQRKLLHGVDGKAS